MKQFRLGLLIAVVVLTASCASDPNPQTHAPEPMLRQCSDSPRNAVTKFFEAVKDRAFHILEALIPDEAKVPEVFRNNDGQRGWAVVRQITANPEIPGEHGCACSPLFPIGDTDDPDVKIVWVKRIVEDNDYKRSFRVHFQQRSNCILTIRSREEHWTLIRK